jgi:glycosyltransferase involved in cell wall biosynthesis
MWSQVTWMAEPAHGPRVTVCMPTRNRAGWLAQSMRSVLSQSYEDFVLLVGDNASEDETPEVVHGFGDPRVRYLRRERDLGLVGNHNDLLSRVETDYVLILPDDDIAYDDLLSTTVEVLDRNPGAGMVHAALDMIGPDGEVMAGDVNWTLGLAEDTVESGAEFIGRSMRYSCRVCASTALMRTAALPDGFFRDTDFPPVDLGLWLRMALSWDMAFVTRTLCGYRIHDNSHSAAFGEPIGSGYVQDVGLLRRLRDVKLRFVDEHEDRLDDPDELRRLAAWSMRRELMVLARAKTLPDRRLRPTLAALREAVAEDPRVLLGRAPWKLLGGSVIGARMTSRLKERTGGGLA